MPTSIGVNLRVTGHCNQGGRKYMEDVFSVAYQQTDDEKDLEFAFFGIFDGHGGKEAALFAKEHLMDSITKQKNFWSNDDELVLKAIREGFLQTQQAMWKDLPNWRKTASGLPSTAGTTASVAFIKRGKLFIGHVGDSGIVLGEQDPHRPGRWRARPLTTDHKPESEVELARIHAAGGKVMNKSGVNRVVWYRPRANHQGPVRRSTPIDEVPFLAVARALGDLWSYNAEEDVFVVSPDPDLHVYELDPSIHRCLVLATDGGWNVLSPEMAVGSVNDVERNNERHMIDPTAGHAWVNPSKRLVDFALDRWRLCNLRADNTSIVTVMLDPPGPPRAQVLRRLHGFQNSAPALPPRPREPTNMSIISRYPNASDDRREGRNIMAQQNVIRRNNLNNGSDRKLQINAFTTLNSRQSDPTDADEGGEKSKTEVQCNEISSSESPPPPLPQRNNVKRKSLVRELAALQPGKPSTSSSEPVASRTRNQSGHAPPERHPRVQPERHQSGHAPVKQPRRSIVPLTTCDSDTENNHPKSRSLRSATMTNLRRSVDPAAADLPVMQDRRPSRRSDPANERVLRPRNSHSTPSCSKRKRRSLDVVPSMAAKVLRTHARTHTWSYQAAQSRKARTLKQQK